jgi:hypothetical protein
MWWLIDRLVGVGGITLNSTGDKTIDSTALPRYATGAGVMPWLVITTQPSNPPPVVSLASYTNQDGTTGRAGPAFTFPLAAITTDSMMPLPLASGDTGVRSVEVLNVATAGGAGVASLLLARPLILTGTTSNTGTVSLSSAETGSRMSPLPDTYMPRIYDGATLEWIVRSANVDNDILTGVLEFVLG